MYGFENIGRENFGESKFSSPNSPMFSTANVSRYTVGINGCIIPKLLALALCKVNKFIALACRAAHEPDF